MSTVNRVLDFMLLVAMITAEHLVSVFGMFFLFGLILYALSRMTRNIFHNAASPKLDMYVTGWIGTPVHEAGHAVFCMVFGHTITDMKFFAPNNGDGSLGYVNHTYNSKSLYQNIGNFFIGAGPIIFGTVILYVLVHYLLPNHRAVFGLLSVGSLEQVTMANMLQTYPVMLSFAVSLAATMFSTANFSSITFWVFLYLSLCVSSHMALSPPDLKGMWKGLLLIVILIFLANILPAYVNMDVSRYVMKVRSVTSGFISLFILAAIISLLNFTVSYVLLGSVHFIRRRSILSIR